MTQKEQDFYLILSVLFIITTILFVLISLYDDLFILRNYIETLAVDIGLPYDYLKFISIYIVSVFLITIAGAFLLLREHSDKKSYEIIEFSDDD